MVDNTREARYADAIWPHERHSDILAAVMAVADEELAVARAEMASLAGKWQARTPSFPAPSEIAAAYERGIKACTADLRAVLEGVGE